MSKGPSAFRTISEVSLELEVPTHVLRFWESRFAQVRPMKRGGGRRYYRPEDVDLLRGVRHLLHVQGYTVKGVQRILKEKGARHVGGCWRPGAETPPEPPNPDPAGAEEDEAALALFLREQGLAAAGAEPGGAPEQPVDDGRARPDPLPLDARRLLREALEELTACKRLLDEAVREEPGRGAPHAASGELS